MRPLFDSVVMLFGLSALTALPACSKSSSRESGSQDPSAAPVVGGPCTYYPPVTGSATVSRIEPPGAYPLKAGDQPCSQLFFDWTGPGPDRMLGHDNFFATSACIATTNLHIGYSFQLTRTDQKTGTCTPSTKVILDPAVAACDKACGGS
jgi:hypothetical protein